MQSVHGVWGGQLRHVQGTPNRSHGLPTLDNKSPDRQFVSLHERRSRIFRGVTFAATRTSAPGWFVRRSPTRGLGTTGSVAGCGGTKPLYGVRPARQLRRQKDAAPQKPLRSAGPSIQECGLDPRRGRGCGEESLRESRPACARSKSGRDGRAPRVRPAGRSGR